MYNIKGIPYTEVTFDKEGRRLNHPVIPPGTTDLIVMSHGWNNTAAAAEELYTKLISNFADVTAGDPAIFNLRIAIIGVIWPSKKFDELMTQLGGTGNAQGGPAGLRRLDPGRPSVGREFSDSIDRKIGQAREHRAEVVAVLNMG